MSAPWIEADPETFAALQWEVGNRQPYLRWGLGEPLVRLTGLFLVRNPETEEQLDGYGIDMHIPPAFPRRLPRVWEIGGRIPRGDTRRHIDPNDGSCCLFVDEEFWLRHQDGLTVLEFLEGPVHDFFLGQLYFELHGEWPWPERSHGIAGLEEAYAEFLDVADSRAIRGFVDFLRRRSVKGRWKCPCGNGLRLRDCHGPRLRELQARIPRDTFQDTWMRLHGRGVPFKSAGREGGSV